MFEDALVDSGNRIRTRSRYWVFATSVFNAAAVAVMIFYPMLYPEALPRTALLATIQAPPPPASAAPKPPAARAVQSRSSVARLDPMTAPPQIPTSIRNKPDDGPPPAIDSGVAMGTGTWMSSGSGDVAGAFSATPQPLVTVRVEKKRPAVQRVSSGVMAGQIVNKTQPVYPSLARAAGVSGAVVLHALIAKDGTVQNLSVVSGPEMLRTAALDAVRQWRYRPYLLNGEPTEVDTTVTVNFTIGS